MRIGLRYVKGFGTRERGRAPLEVERDAWSRFFIGSDRDQILNEVVLNQVLVSFGDPQRTRRVIDAIQQDGTCGCGGTVWQGKTAMRISVCNWSTRDEDVEKSLHAMLRVAAGLA